MGNSCPKCSAELEHDFGVFVCEKCGAVLFVDFDGNVQLSTPDMSGGAPSPAPVEEAPIELQENDDYAMESIEVVDENPIELSSAPAEQPLPMESEPEPVVENNDWADQSVEDSMMQPLPAAPQAPITEVNFEDVIEFANQAELDNSPLVYTLWIQGIDRKETRDKVFEVLKDVKFNLHMKEIIPTIKGGILELRDLNPVKTSLIATRLREEAVQFRWKQNVFQSEAASGT